MNSHFFKNIYVFLLLFSVLTVSCREEDVPDTSVFTVSTRSQSGLAKGGYTFVEVKASGNWTLAIDFKGAEEEWAALTVTSGEGENNGIILNYEKNDEEKSRTLDIILTGDSGVTYCRFVQSAASSTGGEIVPDPVAGWMELPATDNSDLLFFSHFQTIRSSKMRSYSYYWDVENLVAHWVAYPLNSELIGSGSRTDDWGLDPKLPRDKQPVLYKGFRGYDDEWNDGYDRGHQLPSADRLNRAANVQTFYGTNMTPQIGRLNQDGWVSLENSVRSWSRQYDTLYVVTGCTVDGSTKVAYDNDNKAVTVPTAYFKALLGYKKDMSLAGTTAGYSSIGFYYPHEPYAGSYQEKSMTIAELEDRVGINFFVNLPSKVGAAMAEKIESTKDTWLK